MKVPLASYVIVLIIGIFIGFYISRYVLNDKDKDLDTDKCLKFLKDSGYWVTLNTGNKK